MLTRISKDVKIGFIGQYGRSLAQAVADIGSEEIHLIVNESPHDLVGGLVIPENITLEWQAGCVVVGTDTLTINGSLLAGRYHIWGGTVAVDLTDTNIDSVRPEWFGAKGDGATDDSSAIQYAVDSLSGGGVVAFGQDDYAIGTAININISGITLRGAGIDNPRISWGNWATRLVALGSVVKAVFVYDSNLTETVRGVHIRNLTIDTAYVVDVRPVLANVNTSQCSLTNVTCRNVGKGILLSQGCTGWRFFNIFLFNLLEIGIELVSNNHNTNFTNCTANTTGSDPAESVVKVGSAEGHCSNVNFLGCDFEHKNMVYQIDARNVRALSIIGGYMEAQTALNAFIRLGHALDNTIVEGATIQSLYIQGGNIAKFAISLEQATGVAISGCHFRQLAEGAAIVNPNNYRATGSTFISNFVDGAAFVNNDATQGFADYLPVEIKIFDDDVFVTKLPRGYGVLEIMAVRSTVDGGSFMLDASGGVAASFVLSSNGTVSAMTGVLTGTTGADASLNISCHTDGNLYIENRLGALRYFIISLFQPSGGVIVT